MKDKDLFKKLQDKNYIKQEPGANNFVHHISEGKTVIVNEQQLKIYAKETAKLKADYDRLKEKYDALFIDYIELKRKTPPE